MMKSMTDAIPNSVQFESRMIIIAVSACLYLNYQHPNLILNLGEQFIYLNFMFFIPLIDDEYSLLSSIETLNIGKSSQSVNDGYVDYCVRSCTECKFPRLLKEGVAQRCRSSLPQSIKLL